jgi:predicted RNA-binding Zn ribbon-like protein
MTNGEERTFGELMAAASRAMRALDDLSKRDGSRASAAAVSAGMAVYSQLLEYRRTVRMTPLETSLLQSALDLLRARLRFFGESV